jgi:hypothetical protein
MATDYLLLQDPYKKVARRVLKTIVPTVCDLWAKGVKIQLILDDILIIESIYLPRTIRSGYKQYIHKGHSRPRTSLVAVKAKKCLNIEQIYDCMFIYPQYFNKRFKVEKS